MGTYILLLFFHSGPLGHDDSNSTTSIPGFINEQSCLVAGNKAAFLVEGTVKSVKYICLYQPK